jgi:hypothetical protein
MPHMHVRVTQMSSTHGVQQVLEQGVLAPDDATGLVGSRVRVALCCASGAAKEAVQIGALPVARALRQ